MNYDGNPYAGPEAGGADLLQPGALLCATHIAPHFTPVHDEIAPVMQQKGISIAYDGMTVEL